MKVEGPHHGSLDVKGVIHEINEGKFRWFLRALTAAVAGIVCVGWFSGCRVEVKAIAPKPPSVVVFYEGNRGITFIVAALDGTIRPITGWQLRSSASFGHSFAKGFRVLQ